MSFRKNLEYLRKGKKLSQEDLAFKLGISRQSVSKWESGAAYPETEKMLALCKIFDCTLDELMNEDIQEEKMEESRKYTFNDFIKEVSSIVERTIKMLTSMSLKSTIRFIFEILVLFLLILMIRIPFDYVYRAGSNVFAQVRGEFFVFLLAFWRFLIDIVYLVVATVSFVYIYKIRFLDSFEESIDDESEKHESSTVVKNEGKAVGKKVSTLKYDFGVFSILGRMLQFFIKCFVGFCLLFVVFFFMLSVAGLVVEISWILQGIYYWSILLLLIGLILFLGVLIKVMYNFIFNRKTAWQKVFTVLMTTLILFGVSVGVGALELKEFSVIDGYSSSLVLDKEVREFPMKDSLVINHPTYRTRYVEDETLTDRVRIEVVYPKKLLDVVMEESEGEDGYRISVYTQNKKASLKEIYSLFLNDLRRKEIHSNYSYLFDGEMIVYTSKENLAKHEENVQKYHRVYVPTSSSVCYDEEISGDCECVPSL